MSCPYCGSQHPREVSVSAVTGERLAELCPLAPAIGERLDAKYEIVREARRTPTGVIYEAVDKTRGRPVSLKTLLEAISGDGQLAARFRREARAAGSLGDPHILRVLDQGRTPKGLLYVVTERLDGTPLSAWLTRTPRMPIPVAIKVMSQVLAGLATAHKNGIVHRDINPETIFIPSGKGPPEFVKLTDFGIVNVFVVSAGKPGVTGGGTKLVGTAPYVAPEVVRGLNAAVDQRTDLYAAGVVLYQMLCGSTPFQGEDVTQLLRAITEDDYPRPTALRPEIPAGLEAAIVRALERDLRRRYPSAAAMRAEISGELPRDTPAPVLAPPPVAAAPAPVAAAPAPDGFGHGHDTALDIAPLDVSGETMVDLSPAPPAPAEPLLAAPPAATDSAASPPIEIAEAPPLRLDMSARARAVARDRGATAKVAAPPRRRFPWWAVVGGVLGLAVIVLPFLRGKRETAPVQVATMTTPVAPPVDETPRFRLSVSPPNANVAIDHLPVSARELPLDSGPPRAHLIKVAAPGHLTRSFTFTATAGMDLVVRLGHTLPVPLPTDPPPSPAELAAAEPAEPQSRADLDRVFTQLDRYGACLALAPTVAATKPAGLRQLLDGEAFLPCRNLAEEIGTPVPSLGALGSAAAAWLKAVQAGQKTDGLSRLASRFRGEYLTARAIWQLQELACIGRDEGHHVAWHIRRVAIAARGWVRARKSEGPTAAALVKQLEQAAQELAEYVRAGNGVGGIRGADDFFRSTREMLALVRSDRRVADNLVYDACRKLLTDFDALVLD